MISADVLAETTLNTLWELEASGKISKATQMMRSLDLSAAAVDFVLNPDSYYFPNRRGNRFVRPLGVSTDDIPVVAVENNRTYTRPRPALHSLQRMVLLQAGFKPGSMALLDNAFSTASETFTSSGGSQGTASVFNEYVGLPGTTVDIEPKPMMLFNYAGDGPEMPDDSYVSVALHEMTHLAQSLTDPRRGSRGPLKRELEAYGVQAQLVSNYGITYDASLQMAGEVNNFRAHNLGSENFEPDAEFTRKFSEHNIFKRICAGLI